MLSLISYVLAAVCFIFAFFDRTLDGHSLIALGLFFVVLAHIFRHEAVVAYRRAR